MQCPCGSNLSFDACCGPFLRGEAHAPTAEALMRSRYTAYTFKNIDYIANTFAPESRLKFNRQAATQWAEQANWLSLRVVSTEKGQAADQEGVVEFIAKYRQLWQTIAHHERSRFRKSGQGLWLFVEGETPKLGRNEPCPCGSGKKYKQCCGA
jgi:SEC-C motif-containing protein